MKVRDLIARLSALRVAGLLDEWGEELVGTLERQAARGQGPTERQRFAAIALLKRFDPEIVAGALADHIATLTPEKVERIHRDARGREKDSTRGRMSRYRLGPCAAWVKVKNAACSSCRSPFVQQRPGCDCVHTRQFTSRPRHFGEPWRVHRHKDHVKDEGHWVKRAPRRAILPLQFAFDLED